MSAQRPDYAKQIKDRAGDGFAYIATPYSKLVATVGLDEAARLAAEIAGELIKAGIVVYSPIAHGHACAEAAGIDKLDHKIWLPQCFPIARHASVCLIMMFDGWNRSVGVQAEIDFFEKEGVPVLYIEPAYLMLSMRAGSDIILSDGENENKEIV